MSSYGTHVRDKKIQAGQSCPEQHLLRGLLLLSVSLLLSFIRMEDTKKKERKEIELL